MAEHEIITKQPIGGYQSTDPNDGEIAKLPPTVKEILNAKKITVVQHVDPVEGTHDLVYMNILDKLKVSIHALTSVKQKISLTVH